MDPETTQEVVRDAFAEAMRRGLDPTPENLDRLLDERFRAWKHQVMAVLYALQEGKRKRRRRAAAKPRVRMAS